MRASISIDAALLRKTDAEARLLRVSRSRLFALAIGDLLRRRRGEQMLATLNEVYRGGLKSSEKRLLKSVKSKVHRTVKERW